MNASDYVLHHLTHFQVGDGGFWTVNIDSVLVSFILGLVFIFPMLLILRHSTIRPGFWQNFFETGFEFVLNEVKSASPHHVHTIGPLALTIFFWILLMNAMDLFPVDSGYLIAQLFGLHSEFKIVPTTDINVTMGLALFTFLVINVTLVVRNGMINYIKGFFTHPFGIYLFPANFFFRIVEEISRTFSLGMRLFGNIFAGEIIFILLAISPLYIEIPAVLAWSIFHILIILLQAFIFMMLTIINFGLALEHE
jgi:F-type H+-transporting ATPase subunit a